MYGVFLTWKPRWEGLSLHPPIPDRHIKCNKNSHFYSNYIVFNKIILPTFMLTLRHLNMKSKTVSGLAYEDFKICIL